MAKSNGNGGAMSASEVQSKLVAAGFSKGFIAQLLKQFGPIFLQLLIGMLDQDPTPPPVLMKAKKAECEPRACTEDEGLCSQMIAHAQIACLEGDHECCLQALVCALHCCVQCCCAEEEEEDEDDGGTGEE